MDWFGVFAAGLASSFFWPFVFLTAASAYAVHWGEEQKRKFNYGSAEYSTGKYVQYAAIQSIAIMWLVWGILNAVPEPNYTIKKVEVVKEVNVGAKYDDVLTDCMYAIHRYTNSSEIDENKIADKCMKQAQDIALGKPRVLEKIVEKPVLMPKEQRYRTLYNTCMGGDLDTTSGSNSGIRGWSVDDEEGKSGTQYRQERIELCHKQVKEIVGA